MTVAELLEALGRFNPNNLVVINLDQLGFGGCGCEVFPLADRAEGPRTLKRITGESYDCAILEVSEWP